MEMLAYWDGDHHIICGGKKYAAVYRCKRGVTRNDSPWYIEGEISRAVMFIDRMVCSASQHRVEGVLGKVVKADLRLEKVGDMVTVNGVTIRVTGGCRATDSGFCLPAKASVPLDALPLAWFGADPMWEAAANGYLDDDDPRTLQGGARVASALDAKWGCCILHKIEKEKKIAREEVIDRAKRGEIEAPENASIEQCLDAVEAWGAEQPRREHLPDEIETTVGWRHMEKGVVTAKSSEEVAEIRLLSSDEIGIVVRCVEEWSDASDDMSNSNWYPNCRRTTERVLPGGTVETWKRSI